MSPAGTELRSRGLLPSARSPSQTCAPGGSLSILTEPVAGVGTGVAELTGVGLVCDRSGRDELPLVRILASSRAGLLNQWETEPTTPAATKTINATPPRTADKSRRRLACLGTGSDPLV